MSLAVTAEPPLPQVRLPGRAAPLLAGAVLAGLVAVDVRLVLQAVDLQAGGVEREHPWLLTTEGGWPERWGYAQQAAAALLLVTAAVLRHRWLFAAWAAVFGMALADDSLQLHERFGRLLAERWQLPEGVLGLRAQDLGELAVWGLLAIVPLAVVAVLHLRADRPTRRAGLAIAAVVALYALVGIGADQLHVVGGDGPHAGALTVLEDGGELVALSVAVAVAVLLAARGRCQDQRARSSAAASSSPA